MQLICQVTVNRMHQTFSHFSPSPSLSGFNFGEHRRVDEEEERLWDERFLEVEADLEVRLQEQLPLHVGDRRRRRLAVAVGFAVVMVTDAADLPPHTVRAVQLGRREEVEEAVPLGPFRHDVAIAASLSN